MTHVFGDAFTVRLILNNIFGQNISMKFYTDSRSLYGCLINVSLSLGIQLLIDLRFQSARYKQK